MVHYFVVSSVFPSFYWIIVLSSHEWTKIHKTKWESFSLYVFNQENSDIFRNSCKICWFFSETSSLFEVFSMLLLCHILTVNSTLAFIPEWNYFGNILRNLLLGRLSNIQWNNTSLDDYLIKYSHKYCIVFIVNIKITNNKYKNADIKWVQNWDQLTSRNLPLTLIKKRKMSSLAQALSQKTLVPSIK